MRKRLEGVLTALITPFKAGGEVDMAALGRLVARQVEAGVSGLVVCATTGEGSSLTAGERREIITFCIREAGKACLIVAGTGTNSLPPTVENTKAAQDLGCDAALVVTPYYNRPTPDGLVRYYAQLLDRTAIPVILYNVPSRTAVDMTPATVARIASHERCAGIKEASGNVVRVLELRRRTKEGFSILSGDDATFFPLLACGGDGIICTSSNVDPAGVVALHRAWAEGSLAGARDIHASLLDLYAAMFVETNPGPAKFALAAMGLIEPSIRPPLVLPDPESPAAKTIVSALRGRGLLR
jgi:4-hydroxy-tetrahydrodipicolinate synthase